MHGRRIPAQTRGGPNRCSPPATDGLAPEPDCLTMYAILYGQQRSRPPFADFRVNLRDATTDIFRCQRERQLEPGLISLSDRRRTDCKFVFIRVHSWLDESAIPK